VARGIDPDLVGSWPSRATLHRWMTGGVKRLPYPDHCRILEGMFQGWTVDRLLQSLPQDHEGSASSEINVSQLMDTVRESLATPASSAASWLTPARPSRSGDQDMPQALSDHITSDSGDPAPALGRKLIALQHKLRLSDSDTRQLARLAGHVVDLSLAIAIAIEPSGNAVVTYEHEILNLTSAPLRRIPREVWFKHATGSHLKITPITMDSRRLMLQRTHDATHIAKFACQFAPAIDPGELAHFGYSCLGGRFVDEFYWRQDVLRHTRHLTIAARHRQATLLTCSAVEQLPDGSEAFATESILWDHEGEDVSISVTRDYLEPGQALTLRWEIEQ
jgi:hypothetical protein